MEPACTRAGDCAGFGRRTSSGHSGPPSPSWTRIPPPSTVERPLAGQPMRRCSWTAHCWSALIRQLMASSGGRDLPEVPQADRPGAVRRSDQHSPHRATFRPGHRRGRVHRLCAAVRGPAHPRPVLLAALPRRGPVRRTPHRRPAADEPDGYAVAYRNHPYRRRLRRLGRSTKRSPRSPSRSHPTCPC